MRTIPPAEFDPTARPLMLATACRSLRGQLSRAARRSGAIFRDVANAGGITGTSAVAVRTTPSVGEALQVMGIWRTSGGE